jgi:LDH2 family malate/lactate/ureidoglycolate dehydrogenase
VLLDILVAGLTGGSCPPEPAARNCNNVLLVAWDPARFAGHAHFVAEARKLLQFIRETPRKPGVAAIELPGDRSGRTRRERLKTGIPLPGGNWQQLADLAHELGVPMPPESNPA